jgi:aminoglycoside 6'-N-acetyltransferase
MLNVRLQAFDPSRDLALVASWLIHPHVAAWWGDPKEALAAVREHQPSCAALIHRDTRPVGFLCWQVPTPAEMAAAGLEDLPSPLVDVDILIGEPDARGQGVGPTALGHLLAKLRTEGIQLVGLAAAIGNTRALRAYEKAGFRPFRDFREAGQDYRYFIQALPAV